MWIIGCDYHPSMQQIAWVDTETGECGERRLAHCAEAEQFYRQLKQKGVSVRVGMEATGHSRWFERLLGFEGLLVGNQDPLRARRQRRHPAFQERHRTRPQVRHGFRSFRCLLPEHGSARVSQRKH